MSRYLTAAQGVLIQECMAQAGFEYLPTSLEQLEADAAVEPPTWQYAFESPTREEARQEGYGIAARPATPPAGFIEHEARQRAILDSLPSAERNRFETTLAGEPNPNGTIPVLGGCYGEAARQLFDDPLAWAEAGTAVGSLEPEVNGRMRVHEGLLELELDWARCMHGAGYPVNTIGDAYELAARAFGDGAEAGAVREEAKAQEIAIALADATCSDEVGLRSEAARVHDEVVEQLLEEREAEIVAYKEMLDEAVRRAERLAVR